MSEESSGFGRTFAVLGWVVAALSLGISAADYITKLREKPVYSTDLLTWDTQNLPEEVLQAKTPIRHKFSIRHVAGRTIKNVRVTFASAGPAIAEIQLTSGVQGTTVEIAPGGAEALLKRDDLLPGQTVSGYVVTGGITKLQMLAGADDASSRSDTDAGRRQWPNDWPLYAGVAVFVVAVALLAIYSWTRLRRDLHNQAFFSQIAPGTSMSLLISLILIAVSLDLVPYVSVGAVWFAFISYLIIVNYGRIVRALDGLAALAPQSKVTDSASGPPGKPTAPGKNDAA